jgi:hypothetical protein
MSGDTSAVQFFLDLLAMRDRVESDPFRELMRHVAALSDANRDMERRLGVHRAARQWLRRQDEVRAVSCAGKDTAQSIAGLTDARGNFLDPLCATRLSGRVLLLTEHQFEYRGDLVGNLRHGVGMLSSVGRPGASGDAAVVAAEDDCVTYSGEWSEGLPHGRLLMVDRASNTRYDGEWRRGRFHGAGTFVWPDGSTYVGTWLHGKRHGQGRFAAANGEWWFDGEWQNDLKSGHGEEVLGAQRFVGQFLRDQRHGKGTLVIDGAGMYVGEFRDGVFHGRGVRTFANGDVFEGDFVAGLRDGDGVCRYAGGTTTYAGQWLADVRSGRGTLSPPGIAQTWEHDRPVGDAADSANKAASAAAWLRQKLKS